MARPKNARITLTGPASARAPRALVFDDPRIRPPGASSNVLGRYFRANALCVPATTTVTHVNATALVTPAIFPTALVEYVLPNNDIVLLQPGPALVMFWNRVQLLLHFADVDDDNNEIDPGVGINVGDYWTYRATVASGFHEQRIRLGRAPSEGDVIIALLYVIDWDA